MSTKQKTFDLIEIVQSHVENYYGKKIDHREAMETIWIMCEKSALIDVVYDAAEVFAKEKGWKMV